MIKKPKDMMKGRTQNALQMTGRLMHVKFSKKVMVKVRNELHQRIKECILKRD